MATLLLELAAIYEDQSNEHMVKDDSFYRLKLQKIDQLQNQLAIEQLNAESECCSECGGSGVIQSSVTHPNDPSAAIQCPDCQSRYQRAEQLSAA